MATSYKTINTNDNLDRMPILKDIRSLQQQNNFTNENLQTISTQLDRIKNKLDKT